MHVAGASQCRARKKRGNSRSSKEFDTSVDQASIKNKRRRGSSERGKIAFNLWTRQDAFDVTETLLRHTRRICEIPSEDKASSERAQKVFKYLSELSIILPLSPHISHEARHWRVLNFTKEGWAFSRSDLDPICSETWDRDVFSIADARQRVWSFLCCCIQN